MALLHIPILPLQYKYIQVKVMRCTQGGVSFSDAPHTATTESLLSIDSLICLLVDWSKRELQQQLHTQ